MDDATDSIRKAIAGKPRHALVEVRSADVVAAAAAVPEGAATAVTRALGDGAAAANPAGDPDHTVFQYASQLAQLLGEGA